MNEVSKTLIAIIAALLFVGGAIVSVITLSNHKSTPVKLTSNIVLPVVITNVPPIVAEIPHPQPKRMTQEELLQSEESLIQSGNIPLMMVTADKYCATHQYDLATKLYLCIAFANKAYPTEAKFALIRLAKYCYPNISEIKQRALREIFGDDFYVQLKDIPDTY
jgi:hypothetical protein